MRAFDCLHTYARVDRQKSKRYCRSYACVLELCVQLPRVRLVFSVVCTDFIAYTGGIQAAETAAAAEYDQFMFFYLKSWIIFSVYIHIYIHIFAFCC